jgi:hypothetical protein
MNIQVSLNSRNILAVRSYVVIKISGVHEFPSAKYFIPGLGRKPFDLHTNSRQDKNIPQILASNSRQNKICY